MPAANTPVGHGANAGLTLGPRGAELIRRWESLRLKAYLDTEGIPTIGYGTTSASGIPVKMGMVITKQQAEDFMHRTVDAIYGAAVRRYVKVPLRQSEYDVLCSFVYNVGSGAFQRSTLLRKLNRGEYGAVPGELMKWTNSRSGNAKRGLTNRRRAEAAVWDQSGRTPLHLVGSPSSAPEEDIDEDAKDDPKPPASKLPENRPIPPSSDKLVYKSTTLGSAGAIIASAGGIVYEQFDKVSEHLESGRVTGYILVAIIVVAALYVAWRRIYHNQEALVQ
jgi:lysozyme